MEFLGGNPAIQEEARCLITRFEEQVKKLRKSDVESYRRRIEQAPDLKSKGKHMRQLLETNIPACVDLLDRLLLKHKSDILQYLEWMSHRVQVAMSLESFNSARTFAEEALALSRNRYQRLEHDVSDANLLKNLTYKAYVKACISLLLVCRYQGKLTDAEMYLEEAKSVATAENDDDDQHQLLILHGDLLLARGQLNNAIDMVFLPLLRNPQLSLHNKGLLLQKLGNACRSAARWGPAKDYLRQSIQIADDVDDPIAKFDRLTDLGNVYRSEGRIADAIEHQVQHMTFAFKRGDLWGLTVACFNMGFAYYSITPKPELRRALILLSLKHDLATRIENEPLRGMALNNLGKVLCALSQYETALKVMQQSVEVAKKTLNVAGEGMAYGNIGTAYRSLGKYEEAIEYHMKYLQNASSRGDEGGAAIMQRELAIDYICKGDLENAEKQVKDAISTLETIRNKLGSEDESKIANFDKNQAETYSLFQVILCRGGKHLEALAISELARSRALTDLIRERVMKSSGVQTSSWIWSPNFVSRWQDLSQDITTDYVRSADELNTNFLIYSVLKDYDTDGAAEQCLYVWVVLNGQSAKDRERVHFRKVTLSENMKDELLPDSGYFASLTRSFKILSDGGNTIKSEHTEKAEKEEMKPALEKDVIKVPESPEVKDLLSLLESLSLVNVKDCKSSVKKDSERDSPTREFMRETKDLEEYADEDERADIQLERLLERSSWAKEGFKKLLQLYDVCISPVDDILPEIKDGEAPCVTIIPHEFLFSVPFCCLLDDSGKYLVERFVLSYAPSLRALLLLNQRLRYLKTKQGNRKKKILSLGDPNMVVHAVHDLPCSGEEARNVQAIFGSDVCQLALRNDATKKLLLQELKNIDMLHLATHARPQDDEVGNETAGGDYSMRGCLLLASSDDKCDGLVVASEIASVDCTCQMIMLSCCETGLGQLTGDGVVGLYRAFFVAGASSVIVTLWKISDKITPIFMDHFYNQLKATGNARNSLRSAMVYCIREKMLPPHQWAAFSFIGAF